MTKCEIALSQRIWIKNTSHIIWDYICVCIYIYIYIYISIYTHTHRHTHIHKHMDFPFDSTCKKSTCNVGDLGLILGLGRSPGEGNGYPLQCSGLENFMDSPWGYKETDTLRDFQFTSLHIYICIYKAFLIHFNISCSGSQEILKWIRNAFLLEETIPRQDTNFLFLKF